MTTYAVFGLGKSGKASVEYLSERGDKVFAWDDNENSRENIKCTHPDEWNWSEINSLILAPGIPLTHPEPHYIVNAAKANNTRIICDVEILWEDNRRDNDDCKFIGITGTNGKSTTTALLAHILKENGLDVAVGGNLGQAALSLGKHDYYVIEMSSYQLDLIDQTKFDTSILLNFSADHLDRHGSMEGYINAKKNIFNNADGLKLIGRDDGFCLRLIEEFPESITFTKNFCAGDFPNLPGVHNMQNINAAMEAARHCGISGDKIESAAKTFPGLEHRAEFVAEHQGVRFVNDSKATNADSTSNALRTYDDIYWILGGVAKFGGVESLSEYFPKIKKAYLIGEAAEEFAKTLAGKAEYENCATLDKATQAAFEDAEQASGGVILFSPACASFDQFKNFEERGEFFKKTVMNLIHDHN